MHYTYADASFALLEEMGKEALEAMNQTQSGSYHGTLLTDLTDLNGTPEELFLGPLSVGDIRTVESILKAGNLGYARLYHSSGCAPEVYIFSMSPENIASFLGSHQFDCFKMILTDLFDRLILDTIYGFIDHCPDRNLFQQILPHLIPIQQSEEAPKSFPMAAYDTFDAYGLLVDLLQSGKTIEELRQEGHPRKRQVKATMHEGNSHRSI